MKKINGEAGFTLVELLAAAAVLMLLGLILMTGLGMALKSYRDVTAQSEVELLLSTAIDALADDLRFAQEVDIDETVTDVNGTSVFSNFTYTSDSFGPETQLKIDNDDKDSEWPGQIVAYVGGTPKRFLSTGAYGVRDTDEKRAYQVTDMKITAETDTDETDEITFTIYLKVKATANDSIYAETPGSGVKVRCLNPPKETETTPALGGA